MKELDESLPNKYEVAAEIGIPLGHENNEDLTTRQVRQIDGKIGDAKVKKLIEMAETQMAKTEISK